MATENRRVAGISEAEWEELADRSGVTPWVRPGWVGAWWRAFGVGRLEAFDVRRHGTLVGLVPFARARGDLIAPANWHTPAFALLADGDDARAELAAKLFRGGARRVTLSFVRVDRTDAPAVRDAARAARHTMLERTIERSPYVALDGDWTDYELGLGKKFLKELGRRRRLLEREGELELSIEDGTERLDALLDEGFAVEAAAWKGARGTAIASDAPTSGFYREVARWAAGRGWLRLAFLRLNGRAIAFDYAIEVDGVHYLLKTGYDPAYRKLGPGKLLRYEMIARAFADACASYEFLGADEPWKLEWTRTCRQLIRIDAFAPSLGGRVEHAAFAYGRPLAKRILALRHR